MIGAIRRITDEILGRGHASSTVPPFDGALKPNQFLEEAEVVAELTAPEDLATDGTRLLIADGPRVLTLGGSGTEEVQQFDRPITALACLSDGGIAVALDGREVLITGGSHDGARWDKAGGRPFVAVNAICPTEDGGLLVTDGSAEHPYDHWTHDLMGLGETGRVAELRPGEADGKVLADRLAYAFGVCRHGGATWISETWKHRVLEIGERGPGKTIYERMPVYPSRIIAASGGGYWLTAFTARTQLVEFVLREPGFRKRMMREIEPRYWVAPALSSGNTFLEPMQGAHIKTMGILKPWAPPRSYGLVIRLSDEGLPLYSVHSRVDGHNHGVVAVAELDGALYAIAKGPRRLLRLSVDAVEGSLRP